MILDLAAHVGLAKPLLAAPSELLGSDHSGLRLVALVVCIGGLYFQPCGVRCEIIHCCKMLLSKVIECLEVSIHSVPFCFVAVLADAPGDAASSVRAWRMQTRFQLCSRLLALGWRNGTFARLSGWRHTLPIARMPGHVAEAVEKSVVLRCPCVYPAHMISVDVLAA